MVKGCKICPTCQNVAGATVKVCPKCEFDFISAKEENNLLKKQEKDASKALALAEKLKIKEQKKAEKALALAEKLKVKEQKKVEKVLALAEKLKIKEQKTYDSLGHGKKKCPSCDIIMASASKICFACKFDFAEIIAEKKKLAEQKKEARVAKKLLKNSKIKVQEEVEEEDQVKTTPIATTIVSEVAEPTIVVVEKTAINNAEDVLNLGEKRATMQWKYAKKHNCWDHIDWDYVGKMLGLEVETE